MQFPNYRNYFYSMGYWINNPKLPPFGWIMSTQVDLGTRSDTGEPNLPPITTILPVIRVTRNCPRTFRIPKFDPDGDRVRCRVERSRYNHYTGCSLCGLDSDFSLDEEDDDNIIFSNVITSADPNEIISRVHNVEIAFSCVYLKRANLSLGFTHKNPYAFRERGFGAFTFQFEFFETQLFRKQVNDSNYPVEVYLKQMIFMQIEESSSIPNTELFVESCKATPYDNPNSRISYTIIDKGCVRDKTVQIYPSSRSQFRFGMEAFEFIGAHEEVYVTCSVMLCESGVTGTRCSQGCLDSGNHRGKREAAAQTSRHSISQGPLHLAKSSDSRASGPSLNLGTNLIFIVGCLLVCGAVIYRSGRTKAGYQRLPTSDTE
ncbi:CUB and zona pellucida-like domain-containing protein 1 isoform 3-T3 [Odontesthes bonariensis]|uniref:CUB and zona pellucida-like domain-containing protein 1 isoform X3 n=1 Tax=Odontesthes bonariensis TaxID=219752 RepID=UPI003F5842D7